MKQLAVIIDPVVCDAVKPPPEPPSPSEEEHPQSTREAVTGLALQTLQAARECEELVLKDEKISALHDYRVTLRRLRSLLSSIRDVYPEEAALRWKSWLWEAASATGSVRDLDVHLLARKEKVAELPPVLQKGAYLVFTSLKEERDAAYHHLCEHLQSDDYISSMAQLASELSLADTLPPTESGALPLPQQAATRIRHRLHQLSRRANALTPRSPDEEIHDIRIIGKKLRYLLDFFGDLFPGKAAKALSKKLARLQNKLGRFNDATVQQQTLARYATRKKKQLRPDALLALGGLITAQALEHTRLRQKALKALAGFTAGSSLRRFRKQLETAARLPEDESDNTHAATDIVD